MKDIEVNSDKVTTIAVLFFLALSLLALLTDSYLLARHHFASPTIEVWDYPLAIFNVVISISICREDKIRKDYPMGVLGLCLMSLVLVIRIAARWIKGSSEMQQLLWVLMVVLSIMASALILAEGVRWFKRRVRFT